jgi:hypothetical protein
VFAAKLMYHKLCCLCLPDLNLDCHALYICVYCSSLLMIKYHDNVIVQFWSVVAVNDGPFITGFVTGRRTLSLE